MPPENSSQLILAGLTIRHGHLPSGFNWSLIPSETPDFIRRPNAKSKFLLKGEDVRRSIEWLLRRPEIVDLGWFESENKSAPNRDPASAKGGLASLLKP